MQNRLELEIIFSKFLEKYKNTSRIKFIFFYIIIIFYLAIPGFNIPALEISNIRFSGVMEQRLLESYFIFYPQQKWVNYSDITNYLKYGAVAMEDGIFMNHKGIDWESLWESMKTNERRGKVVRGGSTITMQLAKNIYFTTRRSYFRKAKELLVAIRIEKEIPKERILEQYLNIIELGDGIFGVEKCANFYFKKSASEITRDEAARIIAIIPSPRKHKPTDNRGFILNRRANVLDRMYEVTIP